LNAQLAIVLALLAAAIAMFVMNRPRMDAVGLIMLTVLPLTGIITPAEALAGFSDSSIVLLAALFVLGEALVRTGVAQGIGDWLLRTAGESTTRLLVLLMSAVAGLGAFMSSTGVVAIFIPIALRIAQSTGTAPSRLMMPLSMAALISGMLTLVATAPNLVVNSELMRQGHAGFSFFSLTPFGLPVLALGIVYMLFARRWLSAEGNAGAARARPTMAEWIERYALAGRERRVRILPSSPLAGKTIGELALRKSTGTHLLAIERQRGRRTDVITATKNTELTVGDVLLVDVIAPSADPESLQRQFGVEPLPLSGAFFSDRSQEIGMAEVMVGADSSLVGRSVIDADLRDRYDLTLLGIRRGQAAVQGPVREERLRVGDTLLVSGPWNALERLRNDDDTDLVLLNLPAEVESVLPVQGKAIPALFCLVLMVVLMVSGVVPNVLAALVAVLLLGAFRCMDLDTAYRSIHWKSLILIVGMLPFSIALQKTGGVELAADGLMRLTSGAGTYGVLGALFAITALLGLFISNTATAVLMAPVALALASELGASPYPFAMIVVLAASTAFMTPISSPVNTLVVAPGNYAFSDFVKVGVPFSLIVLVVSVLLVPWLLPL
jgi:di/tricarboxylate transporter